MAKKTDKAKASAVAAKQRRVMAALPSPAAGPTSASVLDHLHAVVLERRGADPALSHSARLLSRGTAKVAQKFGEEAVECLIEAVARNRPAVITESADVLYHLMVLWVDAGVEPEAVWAELRRRQGISGIAEKAARPLKNHPAPVALRVNTRKAPTRKTPTRKIP